MSATEIINELPKLTEAERRAVLNKLRELDQRDERTRTGDAAAQEQAAAIVAFGALIGLLGSSLSVGRHLKRV